MTRSTVAPALDGEFGINIILRGEQQITYSMLESHDPKCAKEASCDTSGITARSLLVGQR